MAPVQRETGEDTFGFRNGLIRDVTYAGIPKSIRADLHEGFAHWLEAQPGFGEHDEIVGYHAEQAHMYLSDLTATDGERTLSPSSGRAGSESPADVRSAARTCPPRR